MKKLIITSTAFTSTAHAGWFGPSQEVIDLQNQLTQQHSNTGYWMTVAGCLAIFVIVAFIIGTILGSKVRKNHGKSTDSREQ